jgi:hypothetical protein
MSIPHYGKSYMPKRLISEYSKWKHLIIVDAMMSMMFIMFAPASRGYMCTYMISLIFYYISG